MRRVDAARHGRLAGIGDRMETPLLLIGAVALLVLAVDMAGISRTVVAGGLAHLVMVVGVYIFIGNSGVVSFGHVAFAALGAYVTGLLTIPPASKQVLLSRLPDWLRGLETGDDTALVLSAVLAAAIAVVAGFALMRLRGIAAGIATLSFLVVVYELLNNYRGLGNGGTLTRIPVEAGLGRPLVWAAFAILLAWLFQGSRTGLRLRAARDEETAARAIGIGVSAERLAAFALGAAVMAVGGGLSAQRVGTISPDGFFLELTFLTLAMLVVGGRTSLSGAVLGTVVLTVIGELLRLAEASVAADSGLALGWRNIVLALLLVLVLLFRPAGLSGGAELRLSVFGRARRQRKRLEVANG